MEIVIDKEALTRMLALSLYCIVGGEYSNAKESAAELVENVGYTPLPKGHGDLIDRSTLEPDTEWSDYYDYWISYSYGQIADADVVIKADGGEKDEVSD